jgi:predicted PurR-regulated permease PerM
LFQQIPDLLTIVGAVLVVAAIVIASSKTFLQNLPQDQNLWIKFKTKFFGITPETKSLNQDQEQNL